MGKQCPACLGELIRTRATDYGPEYDYCRTCKKELAEVNRDFAKPVSPYSTSDGIYRAGSAGFDGSNFLCLGGCGQRVDPALKYCKPTCGMNKSPVVHADLAFFMTVGACHNLYNSCDCNGCRATKVAIRQVYGTQHLAARDEYLVVMDRKPLPCRSEYYLGSAGGKASFHYAGQAQSTCQCGSVTYPDSKHPLNRMVTKPSHGGFSSPMPAKLASQCAHPFCAHQRDGHSSFCPAHRGTPPPDTY